MDFVRTYCFTIFARFLLKFCNIPSLQCSSLIAIEKVFKKDTRNLKMNKRIEEVKENYVRGETCGQTKPNHVSYNL
jgi:hypothetical protein